MIEFGTEAILTLKQAAAQLPHRRRGSRPHVATLYRWAQRGLRGVRLETIQVGGTLCTSVEALQRFFEALGQSRQPIQPTTRAARQREIAAAELECDRAGI